MGSSVSAFFASRINTQVVLQASGGFTMCSIMCFTDKALKPDEFREAFDRTIPRGPDKSAITETASGYLCYHRLAIMDMSDRGMQPFVKGGNMAICNGDLRIPHPDGAAEKPGIQVFLRFRLRSPSSNV